MQAGVYRITNEVNGKVYIGMSVNLQNRRQDHFKGNSGAPKLNNAFRKYGKDKFTFEPIFILINHDGLGDLHKFEAELIESYDSVNAGYNIFPASRGVGSHGPEWAAECKERAKDPDLRKRFGLQGERNPMFGRSRKGDRVGGAVTPMIGKDNPMYGRSWKDGKNTEELVEHARKSARPGAQNGCYGTEFSWINDGVNVKRLALGDSLPSGWKFGFIEKHMDAAREARKRKVKCVTTGVVYDSISDAAKATGSHQSKVTLCCQGKRAKTNGLSWEYC
jgi:group I intron endonuclease